MKAEERAVFLENEIQSHLLAAGLLLDHTIQSSEAVREIIRLDILAAQGEAEERMRARCATKAGAIAGMYLLSAEESLKEESDGFDPDNHQRLRAMAHGAGKAQDAINALPSEYENVTKA